MWTVDSLNFQKRKKVTVSNSSVSADLTDFPLLVKFTSDTDLGAVCQADGDDIRFTTSAGVLLYSEKESFAIADGAATGCYWVKVPTIYWDSTTDIYMYYGNVSASAQTGATSVWDSDFRGVWHLTSAAGSVDGETGNIWFTNYGGVTPSACTAKVAGGYTSSSLGAGTRGDTESLDMPTGNVTISFITKPSSFDVSSTRLAISKWYDDIRQNYRVGAYLATDSTHAPLFCDFRVDHYICEGYGTTNLTAGTYYHCAIVFINSTAIKMYINGAEDTVTYWSWDLDDGWHQYMGEIKGDRTGEGNTCSLHLFCDISDGPMRYYYGELDEVRISNTNRSTAWLCFESHNMMDSGNQLTFGSEETKSYTKGNYSSLPGDDTDLESNYTAQEVSDVSTVDTIRVSQGAFGEFAIHQFKNDASGHTIAHLTWTGQSEQDCSTTTVYLQIYNYNTPEWETLDSDNTTAANTDFTLSADVTPLTNYRDTDGTMTCRVWQQIT